MTITNRIVTLIVACAVGFAMVVAVLAINDRIQVEGRLDDRDDQLAQTDRRLDRAVGQLRRLTLANRDAIRRLERLERPTRLDLQRLFRGLLEAATPEQVRQLVRRLRDFGIVLPRRVRGGGRDKGQPGPPPGP